MTIDQKKIVQDIALKLKQALLDFCGSITFNLSPAFKDVKIEVKEAIKVKQR